LDISNSDLTLHLDPVISVKGLLKGNVAVKLGELAISLK
jgi:hypothetical protein